MNVRGRKRERVRGEEGGGDPGLKVEAVTSHHNNEPHPQGQTVAAQKPEVGIL